ncbi:MAG: hypothetical protein WAT46_01155, partial [Saprospiraceae bacterium]
IKILLQNIGFVGICQILIFFIKKYLKNSLTNLRYAQLGGRSSFSTEERPEGRPLSEKSGDRVQ